jgi:hypothetical protein
MKQAAAALKARYTPEQVRLLVEYYHERPPVREWFNPAQLEVRGWLQAVGLVLPFQRPICIAVSQALGSMQRKPTLPPINPRAMIWRKAA